MMRDNTFELFGPLASNIREILFHDWDPHSSNHNHVSVDIYDEYIPAIHRLVKDRHSTEATAVRLTQALSAIIFRSRRR